MILIYVMNLNEHFFVLELKWNENIDHEHNEFVTHNTQSKSIQYAMPSNGSSLLMSPLRFFDVGEISCACKKEL